MLDPVAPRPLLPDLRLALQLVRASPAPSVLCWGPSAALYANDAAAQLLGLLADLDGAAGPTTPIWALIGDVVERARVAPTAGPLAASHPYDRLGFVATASALPDAPEGSVVVTLREAPCPIDCALRTEARLGMAAEAARFATFELDLDHGRVTLSRGADRVLGLSDDTTALSFAQGLELVHPDDRAELLRALAPLPRERFSVSFRAVCGGEVRWVELVGRSSSALPDGPPIGAVGVVVDITERVRADWARRDAEERLKDTQRRLETALTGAKIATWVRDVEAETVAFDANLVAHFGFDVPPGPMPVRDYFARVHPDDLPELKRRVAEALRTGADYHAEYRLGSDPGRWVSAFGRIGEERGRAILTGILQDVHARKLAELAQDQLFELSVDLLLVGSLRDRGVVRSNPAFSALLGWAVDPSTRQLAWSEAIHPDDLALCEDAFEVLRAGSAVSNLEARFLRPDGAYRWISWNVARSDDLVYAVGRDTTEQRLANEAIVEADRRKTDFIAVLSHELRNPLAPVQNGLAILSALPSLGPQAQRAVEIVGRQVRQLARLVDDLLDVTRIARGKVSLHLEPVDLAEVVRLTVDDHRSLFDAAAVRLDLELAAEPRVHADPHRLAQIVGNLLHNAAKFTPSGGSVRVSVEVDGDALVTVRDDGEGMAPELLARLFEPFQQADRTLHRSRGGLGLGLALVRGLVELHGGTTAARSAGPGRGSEIVVRLPRTEDVAAPVARQAGPAVGRRVLIVEDNLDAAATLSALLSMDGHEVMVRHTGPEGVAAARAFAPDVVLCDIGLPGLDGYGVARALRAEAPSLTLVAVSGYSLPDDVERCKAAGFDVLLSKPPDLDRLAELIARAPRRAVTG